MDTALARSIRGPQDEYLARPVEECHAIRLLDGVPHVVTEYTWADIIPGRWRVDLPRPPGGAQFFNCLELVIQNPEALPLTSLLTDQVRFEHCGQIWDDLYPEHIDVVAQLHGRAITNTVDGVTIVPLPFFATHETDLCPFLDFWDPKLSFRCAAESVKVRARVYRTIGPPPFQSMEFLSTQTAYCGADPIGASPTCSIRLCFVHPVYAIAILGLDVSTVLGVELILDGLSCYAWTNDTSHPCQHWVEMLPSGSTVRTAPCAPQTIKRIMDRGSPLPPDLTATIAQMAASETAKALVMRFSTETPGWPTQDTINFSRVDRAKLIIHRAQPAIAQKVDLVALSMQVAKVMNGQAGLVYGK